ncbi:hypothetical protein ACWDCC_15795 [Streptomyces sp. NPDC001102]
MLLTPKDAAGAADGGFIALTATLSTAESVPATGVMLILGIDKSIRTRDAFDALMATARRHRAILRMATAG